MSGAVFFWGFGVGVRYGENCLFQAWLYIRVIAELRMPTHKGEGTWATHSLTGLGRSLRQFLGSGAVVFWGFWVRCGRVKHVSYRLGSILGFIAELRMPTHKGDCTWATHSLTGLGSPLRQFFGVRCGSFLGFLGPVR